MSITKEEVVDHIKEIRRILDKNGSSKKAFNGIIELEEYFNQQTTPTDIEEVLPVRCSECKYQTINEELDAGTLFGCSKKETIVYDTIGGMKFDRHHNCPLTSIPIKAEEQPVVTSRPIKDMVVEEALDRLYNDNLYKDIKEQMGDSASTILTTTVDEQKEGDLDLIDQYIQSQSKALQDKDNEIEMLNDSSKKQLDKANFEISKLSFKLNAIREAVGEWRTTKTNDFGETLWHYFKQILSILEEGKQ